MAHCAVFGVRGADATEEVHIAVVPAAGHHPEPGTLGNFVTERKGALSAPAAVHIVPDIPLTPVGKPDKKRLRAVLGR
ncbi:AMP-binding enzyme [Streptomyces sp. NBRC 110611]|uniref:AMP-binding enzyme n=1 Tax=Streptomyces sp. NBRC 110611 TaxID=1621259 RepID=UPI0028525CB4|nr:hypothetical protein [Streptomyces sp. NBRC 110611]